MNSAKRSQDRQAEEPDGAARSLPTVVPEPQPHGPITTGDMQTVGATSPEEVHKRRDVEPDEAPVEESPGDQTSG